MNTNDIFQSKHSRFVSYLAIVSIMAAMYLIVQGVSNLMMLSSLKNSTEYRIAEQMIPASLVSPSGTMLEILFQFAGIVASIGLWNRLNWGRIMYMIVLSTMTVWETISTVNSYLSLSQYLNAAGLSGSWIALLFSNFITASISGYILWKLSTKEVRNEFLSKREGAEKIQHPPLQRRM